MDKNKVNQGLRDAYAATETQQVRLADKAATVARREYDYKQALLEVLATQAGKVVFSRMFMTSGLFTSSFDTNALNMARKEGRKEFATELFNDILKYAPGIITELRDK